MTDIFKILIFSSFLVTIQCYTHSNVKLNKCLYNELGQKGLELRLPNTIMGNNVSTIFKLQLKCPTRLPHCMVSCPTELVRRSIPFRDPNNNEKSDFLFTPSGFLKFGPDFFHQDDYCIFGRAKHEVIVEVCRPSCGKTHVCVPKCCSADKVIDYNKGSCEYSLDHLWEPLVYKTEDVQVCGLKNTKFLYFQAPLSCQPQSFLLKPIQNDSEQSRVRFRLLLNGSVVLKEVLAKEWIRPEKGKFCVDGVQNFGASLGPYKGDPLDQILLVCMPGENEFHPIKNMLTLTGILYSFLLFSGTPFLLLTVIVYILLWDKQNVHGWTLFSHTLAMLLNYLGQGVTNTVSRVYDSDDNASTSCKLIGIANHYFVLASFCWLTMINYDLWSMFRHLKSTVGRSRGLGRFIVYMGIAWGLPMIVVIISVILDSKYGLHGVDGAGCETEIIVPFYGHKSCYIVEEARPYFLFYPIGTLMGINLIFAGLTAYNMTRHNQSAKILEKKSTKHRKKFSVWSKLFVVMGVALSSEVVVWSFKEKNTTLPWYLVFPDVLSLFQAIAIFILFACQPKIFNQLNDAYPSLRSFLDRVKQLPCYKTEQNNSNLVAVHL